MAHLQWSVMEWKRSVTEWQSFLTKIVSFVWNYVVRGSSPGTIPAACEIFHNLARAMLDKIHGRYATVNAGTGRLNVEGFRKLIA